MILKLRISPDSLKLLRRAADRAGVKVRRHVRTLALEEAERERTNRPTYAELLDALQALRVDHRATAEDLVKVVADMKQLPPGTQIEVHDSDASVAAANLVEAATAAAAAASQHDDQLERRELVLAAALGELGNLGTMYDGHGGPQIEHIVRAKDNEYHRYWIVLTAAGKRALERLDPQIKSWGAKVLALVEAEEGSGWLDTDGARWDSDHDGPYLAPPEDWCAMFVTWAIGRVWTPGEWWDWKRPGHVLEGHPFGRWFGGVTQLREWAEAEGVYLEAASTSSPSLGSVFVLPGDTHVGFVLEVLGEGKFRTIEGNLSDAVQSVERHINDCAGFVEWWAAT